MGNRISINKAILGASVVTMGLATYFIVTKPADMDVEKNLVQHKSSVEQGVKGNQELSDALAESQFDRVSQRIPSEQNESTQHGSIYVSNTFESTQVYEAASQFGVLPSNMRDVRIEQFEFNEKGDLVLSSRVKNIIEFFLLASESEGYEQAVARLEEYIVLTLPGPAQTQALEVVQNYLAYKQNMKDQSFPMTTDLADADTLKEIRNALNERKQLRRDLMGQVVSEALFGYEEQYDDFSLTRVEINGNLNLSPEEKDQKLAEAEQRLPERLANKMRHQREERKVNTQIESLQEQGGNADEIYRLRKDFYGQDVADRYAYLEDNSPEWQSRVNSFYSEQNQILKDVMLSHQERAERLQQLKQESFSQKERVKLAVQAIRGMI